MNFETLFIILIVQVGGSKGCFPKKSNELTSSYIPAAIQVLEYYSDQIRKLYPFSYFPHCHCRQIEEDTKKTENNSFSVSLQNNNCVDESLFKINSFLDDLKREVFYQRVEFYEGFSEAVLLKLEKTSMLTSVQQFHFILENLLKEEHSTESIKCKIIQLMEDLNNSNSKLFQSLRDIKPFNYLGWR